MKKRILPMALGLLLLSAGAYAQSRPIKGQVLDDKGEPVVGVSVQIKGTHQGTITDADGNFSLEVPDEDNTLIFRSVGFKTQEVQVGDGLQPITVHFTYTSTTLDETVVVGYTSVKRKDITGSVSSVGQETIKDIPNVTVEKAMQGRMPGVHVVQNSGTPGSGIDVRVRGTTSINGNTQPLYVIDGVPVTTGNPSQLDLGGQDLNALAQIDPNDIASIEVLKDAATAAMYGARAANGVVLITTKSGSYGKGQATVHVNTSFGTQNAWKKLKTLNNQQYFELIGDEIRNYTGDQTISNEDAMSMVGMPMNKDYTNYLDYIFQPGQLQNHSVDVSGGGEKTSYYASVGYFKNDGILRSSSLDRYSTRLNLKTQATERISLSTNLGFTRTNERRVRNDNNIYGYLLPSLLTPPDYTLYNDDGTYTPNPLGWANPASIANSYYNHVGTNRFIGNVSAEVKIFEGLSLVSKVGADMMSLGEDEYDPANTAPGAGANGTGISATTSISSWLNEDYLSFNRTFGKSNIIAAAGISFQESKTELVSAQASNFSSIHLHTLDNASTPITSSSSSGENSMRSYYANVHYSYADRYLISGSFRYDASSRFSTDHKWATFPGVSAAWRISNENFFSDLKRTISDLKLRIGYGVTGNLLSGDFPTLLLYSTRSYADAIGFYYSQLENPELEWEKNNEFDLGLDIGFINNRIYVTADFYNRITPNLILSKPYAAQTGFPSRSENIGKMKNQGVELNITSQNIVGKNFNWTTTLNLSHNKNTVEKLYEGRDIQLGFSGTTIIREGEEIGSFYGYKIAGIFQNQDEIDNSPTQDGAAPGDFKFVDENGDGIINDDDRVILGSPNPKLFGGFGNTLTYKGLSLDIFCQFSVGNKIFNANKSYINGMNSVFNQTDEVLDRWTPDNHSTTMPRAIYGDPNNNWRNSSAMVEDGSYFRIKNVTLAYNFNDKTLKFSNGIIKGLRIYATANNLLTFTKYSGFDPEVNMFSGSAAVLGTDFGTYPQARSFVFGANFTF